MSRSSMKHYSLPKGSSEDMVARTAPAICFALAIDKDVRRNGEVRHRLIQPGGFKSPAPRLAERGRFDHDQVHIRIFSLVARSVRSEKNYLFRIRFVHDGPNHLLNYRIHLSCMESFRLAPELEAGSAPRLRARFLSACPQYFAEVRTVVYNIGNRNGAIYPP